MRGRPVKRVVRGKRPGDGAERVYDGLRRVIVEQTLAAGARLPEDMVAARFGVSRTLVRTAISRLVTDGLVERENNKVARVACPTAEEAEDLFRTRRTIEGAVIDRLTGALSKKDAERLRAHVRLQRSSGNDRPTAVRLSGEFHILLAEICGSAMLRRYVSELVGRSSVVLTAQSTAHALFCSAAEHSEIIDALVDADKAVAHDRMCRHLQNIAYRAQQLPGPAKDFTELPDEALSLLP